MRTAVLAFGNPIRNDDGIGPHVLAELRRRVPANEQVSYFDLGSAAFEVIFALRGHDRFLIVDAVTSSGEVPGTLFEVPAEVIEQAPRADPVVYLHGLKWSQCLAYARRILGDAYPRDITVYLVAVDDLDHDMRISPPVLAAGATLVERLEALLCSTADSPATISA
ncbi:MAG: hydrogenase maturation protease [Gemmatimonadaceae bacterium]|jgi:hydrogenase maturation protease|nr:hydrogenase maturation protease [Gemmatimonadaceae bacterium]